MRRLFIIICGLIAYGSLYPWEFHHAAPLWRAGLRVFHDWPWPLSFPILKDMALNVVVYAPLGLTGYLSSARGFRWARAAWPIAFGFALSLALETLQSYLPGRVPSGMDLLCNTAGAAAGVGIAAAYESAIGRWFQRLNPSAMRPSSALMMLIIFAAQYAMPLATNSLRLLAGHERASFQQGDWPDFANAFAGWLLASHFMEAVRKRAWPVMAAALMLALATRLIAPNLLFSWPMLAGAAAGVAVWKLLYARPGIERVYALVAFVWLVGDGLRPYTFIDHKAFDWIPFRGMMGADWTGGVTALLIKTWMYGSAFWTWERAGASKPQAVVALLVVLAGIEFAQQYLPGRVSTMTDIAMGAIAAGLLWAVERKYGASAPAAAP